MFSCHDVISYMSNQFNSLWPDRFHLHCLEGKCFVCFLGSQPWSHSSLISMVSCPKGPTHHAYAWQIGPFRQDTVNMYTWTGLSLVHRKVDCLFGTKLVSKPMLTHCQYYPHGQTSVKFKSKIRTFSSIIMHYKMFVKRNHLVWHQVVLGK